MAGYGGGEQDAAGGCRRARVTGAVDAGRDPRVDSTRHRRPRAAPPPGAKADLRRDFGFGGRAADLSVDLDHRSRRERRASARGDLYLNEPAVRPETIRRCANRTRSATGIVVMTTAASIRL